MKTRDFCFWLQGIFEVGKVTQLDAEQTALVRQHLDLVFQHDPSITGVEHGDVSEFLKGTTPLAENPAIDLIRRFKIANREPKGFFDQKRDKLLC